MNAGFAERILRQLQARYKDVSFEIDNTQSAILAKVGRKREVIHLAALHNAIERDPTKEAEHIIQFVNSVAVQLNRPVELSYSPARVLWCVRTKRYLKELTRSHELLTRDLPGDLVGFVAETLPGSWMRGVPRTDWIANGYADEDVAGAATTNTEQRFARIADRIRAAERVPRDGWRLSSDVLFQGSIAVAPSVLSAFVGKVGGDILIGIPDRSVVVVCAASPEREETFRLRVGREFREAMNPCSEDVLRFDGRELTGAARRASLRKRLIDDLA